MGMMEKGWISRDVSPSGSRSTPFVMIAFCLEQGIDGKKKALAGISFEGFEELNALFWRRLLILAGKPGRFLLQPGLPPTRFERLLPIR